MIVAKHLEGLNLPVHMQIALDFYGIQEISGIRSNPLILGWAKELGLEKIYTNDDIAWCGLAFAICMKRAKRPLPQFKDPYDYLRALKYRDIYLPVEKGKECIGDILIFQRPSGGHIGFNAGNSKNTFHVLGGNQSNAFNIAEIEKSRLVAARRPNYINYIPFDIVLDSKGKISTNEA